MRRGLIALTVVATAGLATAAPAMATPTLASSGDATSVTASSADLNGVVYREHVGARWLFEYSTDSAFDTAVSTTAPESLAGRLSAVEQQVTGLAPATRYYWRVVLTVRSGTQTLQTFGATRTLTTAGAPGATPPPASTPSRRSARLSQPR